MRRIYMEGSERLERYLSIAEDAGVLTAADSNFLLQMEGKAKSMCDYPELKLHFTSEEKARMKALREKLGRQFSEESHKFFLKGDKISYSKWNKKETKAFQIAYRAAVENKRIEDPKFSLKDFKQAAVKIALHHYISSTRYYTPEAWFVPLATFIQEFEGNYL